MKLGIVGLPNVGKSTLFNSLTKAGAESANYPFCTIDPNVGVVTVPDERLKLLGDFYDRARDINFLAFLITFPPFFFFVLHEKQHIY